MAYPPISDYAIVGNCRSAALVSRHGSIDWLCLPHFSGGSVFGALLDAQHGGRFSLCPHDILTIERRYLENTNVLETTFRCQKGVLRLTDFMTVSPAQEWRPGFEPQHELVRVADCVAGAVSLEAIYQPRPDYGRPITLTRRGALGWCWQYGGMAAYLQTDMDFDGPGDEGLRGVRRLEAGQAVHFSLAATENDVAVIPPLGAAVRSRLRETTDWWRSWVSQCSYQGSWRSAVLRSCLTLKLLSYCQSGAVVAAATTSVPAGGQGTRAWDYRYCWLRDSSIVLGCFIDLGFRREARAYLEWLLHATRLTQPRLQVLYDIYGETKLRERELPRLEGYRGAGHVQVGNGAHEQTQLDIYGEVMQAAYRYAMAGGRLDRYERKLLAGFGNVVLDLWRCPDSGIWEVRTALRHHTHSKCMCWAALDGLLRLDSQLGLVKERDRLAAACHEIRADIGRQAFDTTRNCYVGYYGGTDPDAALLLLPRLGFVDANAPRMVGTFRHIEERLCEDGFVYRYPPDGSYDGVEGRDNTFTVCGFWLVDYLARSGQIERACRQFERLLDIANDVGLYAEEFDTANRAQVGNYPLAFVHVELIMAALTLDVAMHGQQHLAAVA